MIDFLRNKGIKAYNEIIEISEQPNLLFSNDRGQYNAEASYNLYTIQKLNKLIKKNNISIDELEKVFVFIEESWSTYLNNHYKGRPLFFTYGEIFRFLLLGFSRFFYEELELPFRCILTKVNDIQDVLIQYKENAQLDGITIIDVDESDLYEDEEENDYILTVYSKIIKC